MQHSDSMALPAVVRPAVCEAGDPGVLHPVGAPGAEPHGFASHADEYDALIGRTQDDIDYVSAVQRVYFEAEAGRHASRMLGLLLNVRGDLIPRRDLQMLAAEVQHIAHGGRIPVDASPHANPCDCPVEWLNVRDTRCIRAVK